MPTCPRLFTALTFQQLLIPGRMRIESGKDNGFSQCTMFITGRILLPSTRGQNRMKMGISWAMDLKKRPGLFICSLYCLPLPITLNFDHDETLYHIYIYRRRFSCL